MINKKYLKLVERIAIEYSKPKIDVLTDVLNVESQIKYSENRKEYRPLSVSYYMLAIGKVRDQYKHYNKLLQSRWIL